MICFTRTATFARTGLMVHPVRHAVKTPAEDKVSWITQGDQGHVRARKPRGRSRTPACFLSKNSARSPRSHDANGREPMVVTRDSRVGVPLRRFSASSRWDWSMDLLRAF